MAEHFLALDMIRSLQAQSSGNGVAVECLRASLPRGVFGHPSDLRGSSIVNRNPNIFATFAFTSSGHVIFGSDHLSAPGPTRSPGPSPSPSKTAPPQNIFFQVPGWVQQTHHSPWSPIPPRTMLSKGKFSGKPTDFQWIVENDMDYVKWILDRSDRLKGKLMLQLIMFIREHYQRTSTASIPPAPPPYVPNAQDAEMMRMLLARMIKDAEEQRTAHIGKCSSNNAGKTDPKRRRRQ